MDVSHMQNDSRTVQHCHRFSRSKLSRSENITDSDGDSTDSTDTPYGQQLGSSMQIGGNTFKPLKKGKCSKSSGQYHPIRRPRNTANARERDRTHSVNSAFVTLRTMIPTEPADRKLSKIETLRLATSYISHLHTVLLVGLDCGEQPCVRHREMTSSSRSSSSTPHSRRPHPPDDMPKHICTFCLSASKVKNQPSSVMPESCMYTSLRQPMSMGR